MGKLSARSELNLPCFVLHRLRGCGYSEHAKQLLDKLFGDSYTDIEYTKSTRGAADELYKDKWSSWPKVTFVIDNPKQEIIIGGYDDLVKLTDSIRTIFSKDVIESSDIDNAILAISAPVEHKTRRIRYLCLVHLAKAILLFWKNVLEK